MINKRYSQSDRNGSDRIGWVHGQKLLHTANLSKVYRSQTWQQQQQKY